MADERKRSTARKRTTPRRRTAAKATAGFGSYVTSALAIIATILFVGACGFLGQRAERDGGLSSLGGIVTIVSHAFEDIVGMFDSGGEAVEGSADEATDDEVAEETGDVGNESGETDADPVTEEGDKKAEAKKGSTTKSDPKIEPPAKVKPRTTDGKTAKSATGTTARTSAKARIAVVLDDFGYSGEVISSFNALPIPLTYAVLPYKDYSMEAATSGHAAGKDIMLHLPMESLGHENAEPITIETSMSDADIRRITKNAVDAIPHVIGVNNHQGSAATADGRVMENVIGVLKNDGLFFLDSRTNGASVAASTARAMGVRTGVNELFLDNDNAVSAIEAQLRKAMKTALASPGGYTVVIGHARPNTATALRNMIGEMQRSGIEFVFVRSVLY